MSPNDYSYPPNSTVKKAIGTHFVHTVCIFFVQGAHEVKQLPVFSGHDGGIADVYFF